MTHSEPLRARLEALHAELARADSIDEESQALLRALAADIQQLLERGARAAEPAEGESLNERLQKLALRFETDHPRLAATLNRLTDSLAKMGI